MDPQAEERKQTRTGVEEERGSEEDSDKNKREKRGSKEEPEKSGEEERGNEEGSDESKVVKEKEEVKEDGAKVLDKDMEATKEKTMKGEEEEKDMLEKAEEEEQRNENGTLGEEKRTEAEKRRERAGRSEAFEEDVEERQEEPMSVEKKTSAKESWRRSSLSGVEDDLEKMLEAPEPVDRAVEAPKRSAEQKTRETEIISGRRKRREGEPVNLQQVEPKSSRENDLENESVSIPLDNKDSDEKSKHNGEGPMGSESRAAQPGKLLTFYRNGDPHFRGLPVAVHPRSFKELKALLNFLNEKIPTPTGVRFIFRLPDGAEVINLRDVQPAGEYVVSSVRKLIHNVPYGSSDLKAWSNRRMSAGRFRRADRSLLTNRSQFEDPNEVVSTASSRKSAASSIMRPRPVGRPVQPVASNRARTITIISNTDRDSHGSVLINPMTQQSFEDLLYDFTNLLRLDQPPVQTLYTASAPFRRVCSFSQLFRDFKDDDAFIACGREFLPVELRDASRHLPMRSGSSPAFSEPRDLRSESGLRPLRDPGKPLRMDRYEQLDENPISAESDLNIDDYPQATDNSSESLPASARVEPCRVFVRGATKTLWPPSAEDRADPNAPRKAMKLDWVYGFNSRMRGQCLFATKKMELLYAIEAVAVLYSLEKGFQRRYLEHDDVITSIALHPTEKFAASGQQGSRMRNSQVHVRIWDIETLATVCIIGKEGMQTLITSLSFSTESNGEYLLILDGIQGHHRQSLFLWDWKQKKEMARTKTSRDYVYQACFHVDDDTTLISFGRLHINFWRVFWSELPGGPRILRDKKSGLFQVYVPDEVLCLAFDLVGNVITGDSHGCLQVWSRDEEDAFVAVSAGHLQHAHKDRITAIMVLGDGTLVSASQNSLRAWDTLSDYCLVKERLINSRVNPIVNIASRHPDSIDGELLLARGDSSVLEGSLQDTFRPTQQFHEAAPVVVAHHPREHAFVSAGNDSSVKKWSALRHQVLWSSSVEFPCSAIAFHPQGHLIAIGTKTGRFVILRDETGGHVMSCQVDALENAVNRIQYSPDGAFLALACLDNCIYIFVAQDNGMVYRKHLDGSLKGHTTSVTGIDWTTDGLFFRSQSVDDNVLHWNVKTMKICEAFDLRNKEFASDHCLVSYGLKGLWAAEDNNSGDYLCSARSTCNDLICLGSCRGGLHLYNYPVLFDQAKFASQKVHVGEVFSVGFLFDDSYIISSGSGRNGCVVQWSVNRA